MTDSTSRIKISRRNLLKLLAAGGGSIAASGMLPGKWLKPLVRVGVLPAHAQSSPAAPAPTATAVPAAPTQPPPPPPPPPQQLYSIAGADEDYYDASDFFVMQMRVQITPPAAGIVMQARYQDFAEEEIWNPLQTLQATTNASGEAVFDEVEIHVWSTLFRVTYSFVNPASCSTNCSLLHEIPLERVPV